MEAISVISEGLRLLRECKVPRFCSHAYPDQMDQMQGEWSERLLQLLPQLLAWIQQHRKTLFDEEWGSVTWEFRKYFVLVYFEQVNQSLEYAPFRLVADDADDLEFRLSTFKAEVDRILTTDANSGIRSWLFHYYGSELAMQGWQCRPGETYSLVRLCHFLVENERETDVRLGPRVVSFLETFGKQLLGYRQNPDYQVLGLMLTKSVMKHTYNNRSYTNDSEEILQLTLNLIGTTADQYDEDVLWDVVYYAVKFIRDPNTLLDDEILRILGSLLNQSVDIRQSLIYLKVLIQMLLLDLPEVKLEEFEPESCTISGRKCDREEFCSHIKTRLQDKVKRRISNQWRLRSGALIPRLLTRFVNLGYERSWLTAYQTRYYLQGLVVLLSVTIFPVGQTRRQQRFRVTMLGSLLDGIHTKAKELVVTLERTSNDPLYLKDHLILHESLLELYAIICSGILELERIWNLSEARQPHGEARDQMQSSLALRKHGAWESLMILLKTMHQSVVRARESDQNQAVGPVG
ncbi:uncharacterized protein LOC135699605 [Ochlerotatus camptorhynchus]|uniref:uncharacterized protein LOC135699605 n=1 Tax=Ochlerotatus camptorhynchus TaxID=644619 RepID=UPI0031CF7584